MAAHGRSGGPAEIERAPRVRDVQLAQLRAALPGVVEELDLKLLPIGAGTLE